MTDISEIIQQPIEEAGRSKINSRVALLVAITATFMALCNVKDSNIVQAMSQAQVHGSSSPNPDTFALLNRALYFLSNNGKRAYMNQLGI